MSLRVVSDEAGDAGDGEDAEDEDVEDEDDADGEGDIECEQDAEYEEDAALAASATETRAGSRPSARTVCPPESRRGTSSEPAKPEAPVTRMRIRTDDDAPDRGLRKCVR